MQLQGALRNAITTFVRISPVLKDTIWSYLEQYDLPVVIGNSAQPMSAQVDLDGVIFNTFFFAWYSRLSVNKTRYQHMD